MKTTLFALLPASCLVSFSLAEVPPAHIVHDLPPELDLRLAPAFVPPAHIVRDMNAAENAARETAVAPVDHRELDLDCAKTAEQYALEERRVESDMRAFFIDAKVVVPVAEKKQAAAKPQVPPSPADGVDSTKVTCADGCYFDMEQGVVVFMRDVKVRGEDMSLNCDNELKIFALREENKKRKEPKEESKNNPELAQIDFNFNMNKPRLITASGNVEVRLKDKKGEEMGASGDKLTYNGVTGETILTGGDLSMTRGKNRVDVSGPDAFIRIYKDGNAYIKGRQVVSQATGLKAMREKRGK